MGATKRQLLWAFKGKDYMGMKWLIFLIRPLDLISMWFGEDQKANLMMPRV
jgi:hypothetical protein